MSFFEQPILNSPYLEPHRHWELEDNRPTDRVLERRRPSALWTAIPSVSARSASTQTRMAFDELSTEATELNPSPYVNDLRQELDVWRRLPNPSHWKVTPTTQRLLQHWRGIQRDESQTIRPFYCQLEAVEAAVWLTEVAPQIGPRGRRFLDWLKTANSFALQPEGAEPSSATPDLMRIAFKLATGAGKLRDGFDAAGGTRRALEGHGEALQTLETEGQMIQRVMGDLMGIKGVVVINDEAHHCYRERPVANEEKLTGDDRKGPTRTAKPRACGSRGSRR